MQDAGDQDPPAGTTRARHEEDGVDLVDLVADALEALEDGGEKALEALLDANPEHATTVRRRLSLLLDSGLDPQPEGPQTVTVPETLGDFRLLRQLGHGGMGVVWLAEERSLGRQVALKLVRPDQLLFPGARARFRREVEVIARLQHPGIVPVYSVGEERGLPYFAMEYVVGATLSEALSATGSEDPRIATGATLAAVLPAADGDDSPPSPFFEGSWNEVCVRIAREVAEALEHARRRGVVHRDVKPSNVLLTRGGRVQLFDFGLSSREGDARITRTGAVLGSLAYMPPEALSRDGDPEDPRQDVYGLGVTLYELLAMQLPFPITNTIVLQRAILEGDARPLRSANPSVPADLAAIVGKAMDVDPDRRYATPGALAEDLARYLDRRPVLAVPPSLWLRTRRWVERSPARAAAVAALVLTPTVLLVQQVSNARVVEAKNVEIGAKNEELQGTNTTLQAALGELEQANQDLTASRDDLDDALAEATRQRAVAEQSFGRALDVIDTMVTEVAEERLASVPGLEDVRRDLFEQALRLYEWFLEQELSSPELRREVARVARRAGDVSGNLNELDAAKLALDRSEELLEELVEENPGDVEATITLADSQQRQAMRARLQGDVEEAVQRCEQGLALLDGLDRERLNRVAQLETRRARSGLLAELAAGVEEQGDRERAGALLDEAVALLRSASELDAENPAVRYDLTRALDLRSALRSRYAYAGIGMVAEADRAELERAAEELEEALVLAEGLVEEAPENAQMRFRLGRVLVNRAYVLSGLGEIEGARATLALAIEHQERIFSQHPEVHQYRVDLAVALQNHALQLLEVEPERAAAQLERVGALLEASALGDPANFQVQSMYGMSLGHLAVLAAESGDLDEAARLGRRALAFLLRAHELSPVQPIVDAQIDHIRQQLETAFEASAHWSGRVALAAGHLRPAPDEPDLEAFAAETLELVEQAPEAARAGLSGRAAEFLASALHARELDVFALLDVASGPALLDTQGFGAALEEALAKAAD